MIFLTTDHCFPPGPPFNYFHFPRQATLRPALQSPIRRGRSRTPLPRPQRRFERRNEIAHLFDQRRSL